MLLTLLSGKLDFMTAVVQILASLVIIFLIMPFHEWAHAFTAYKLGDTSVKARGRMSLNPIEHIDPIGALMILLIGFGWAKPVPIDPTRFDRKHSMRFGVAITALAGPVSNLIAAFVGMVAMQFYQISSFYTTYYAQVFSGDSVKNTPLIIWYMLYTFVYINIGLAVFNLLPIPPLDGSKIASYFTSGRFDRWFQQNYQIIRIVFLGVMVTGILSVPLNFLDGLVFSFLQLITSWIPALFG